MPKKFEYSDKPRQQKVALTEDGKEITDPKPMAVRVRATETMTDRVRRMVRQELSQAAASQEMETFEEANDFDIEDPWDVYHTQTSDYELLEEEFPIDLGAPDPSPQVDEKSPGDPGNPPDRQPQKEEVEQ